MMDRGSNGRGLGELRTPARNNYFYGKLMDVWHFEMEQAYHNRKRWLMNRLSLGSGVLCGLQVAATSDGTRIRVGPGVAVDQFGREIVVPTESPAVDPRQPTDECGQPSGDPIAGAAIVTLCIRYLECASDPAPAMVGDCDTREGCLPSTIRERYMLQIHTGTPDDLGLITAEQCTMVFPTDPAEDLNRRETLCETFSGACAAPDDDCVVLATIELTADGAIGAIDACGARPVLYSNAMLLDLILCLADRVDECCTTLMLRYVSGDNQSGVVGSQLPQPLVADVLQHGAPVAGETVTFAVSAGDGLVGDDPGNLQTTFDVMTGADGRATLPIWQLGQNPGQNEVRASIAEGMPSEVLYHATAVADEREIPVVRAIWPPNGVNLREQDAPELLERWLDAPWIEVTFSQEMSPQQLVDQNPWLRMWRIRSFGQNEIEVSRLALRGGELADDPVLDVEGFTYLYRIGNEDEGFERSRFLVQMRAENGNIQNTETPPLLLDAEYRGSRLEEADLDRIWDIENAEFLGQEIWDRLVDTGEPLPQSGEGSEGGRFNSWFELMSDVE